MTSVMPQLRQPLNDTPRERRAARFCDWEFFVSRMKLRFGANSWKTKKIINVFEESREAHLEEGLRKNGDERVFHELRIAGRADADDVDDYRVYVAIGRHDMCEDYGKKGYTFKKIEEEDGNDIRIIVEALTKGDSSNLSSQELSNHTFNKINHIERRELAEIAVRVKLYDREDSFEYPWEAGRERLEFKMDQTLTVLVNMAVDMGLDTRPILRSILALKDKYYRDDRRQKGR